MRAVTFLSYENRRVPHEHGLRRGVRRVAAVGVGGDDERGAAAVMRVDIDVMVERHEARNWPLVAGSAPRTRERCYDTSA